MAEFCPFVDLHPVGSAPSACALGLFSLYIERKSRIRETKHLLTDADISTDTKKINKKKIKKMRDDFTPFMSEIIQSETTSFHYFSPRIQKF